jgi:hypothetical protein
VTSGPLDEEHIVHFKSYGFLIMRRVLDPVLLARARARLWDAAPPSMRRDNPDTWTGPIKATEEDTGRDNYRKGFRWQYRAIGSAGWMIDLLPLASQVWRIAEQLLGEGEIVPPDGVRGIYCTLPYGQHTGGADGCHVDAHPFHLGVVGYIDDVAANGGGFRVWPGSHRTFYPDFASAYCMEPRHGYEADKLRISRRPSVDCHGRAGDVVFWHHRLGHMAAHNYTRHIRQAVLYDFRKKDLALRQQEPPAEDMWEDWSLAVRRADATGAPP